METIGRVRAEYFEVQIGGFGFRQNRLGSRVRAVATVDSFNWFRV